MSLYVSWALVCFCSSAGYTETFSDLTHLFSHDVMWELLKRCQPSWTWCNHCLLGKNVYSQTGWQWLLEVAGFSSVKVDTKRVLNQKKPQCLLWLLADCYCCLLGGEYSLFASWVVVTQTIGQVILVFPSWPVLVRWLRTGLKTCITAILFTWLHCRRDCSKWRTNVIRLVVRYLF